MCNRSRPSTDDDIIESLSEYTNYRTSIAIRRHPKRFVRAVANDARKRSHLLLSQHAKKKARDNYYGRDASFLPLSHFSPFLFISPLQATPRCSPIPFIYTLFSSTSALLVVVISLGVIISFIQIVVTFETSKCFRKIVIKRIKFYEIK